MMDALQVEELAAAVADGRPFDWEAAARGVRDVDLRETLANLRAIAEVGHVLSSMSAGGAPGLARPSRLEPGATWGSLRIVEHIGAGRFGDVYRAFDPALDREVALKLTRAPREEAFVADVVHEGRLMARVHHPNVVTIFGAQRIGEVSGLWMEIVEGPTLAEERQARGAFDAEDLRRVGVALCGALQAVHEAGLVHRDVKAQNVLRAPRGRIVLGDFGTGRDLDGGTACLAGTPAYVAPELFAGRVPGPRTDVYSLGVLLFHLATGAFPVSGRSLAAIRDAHALGERLHLSALRPDLPAPLRETIDRALAVDPVHRFPSAAAMRAALDSRPAPPAGISRRGWLVAAGLLLATAVTVGSLTSLGRTTAVPFAARDWVLLTPIENQTGEPQLDRALDVALSRELSASTFVNVVPPERVQDTLQLMRRDPGTPITVDVAREVAVRDGRVNLVLAGSVEKLGPSYVLGAALIVPGDGSVAWSVTERARSTEQLLEAVRRISHRLRTGLGESPAAIRPNQQLAFVTTSSLRALQLYSQAVALLDAEVGPRGAIDENLAPAVGRSPGAAAALLAEALALDPEFALAHLARAAALGDATPFNDDRAEMLTHLDRAEETAVRSPDTERLFVQGRVAFVRSWAVGPSDAGVTLLHQAAAAFEALAQIQPDNLSVLVNLSLVYRRLGRTADAAALTERIADLRPNNPGAQLEAARVRLAHEDMAGARHLVERVQQMPAPPGVLRPLHRVWLSLFPAHEAWVRNDVREALRITQKVREEIDHEEPLPFSILCLYLTLGQFDEAERYLARTPGVADRDFRFAMILDEREDTATLRQFLRARFSDMSTLGWRVGSFWMDAGLVAEARAAAVANPVPSYLGQVALAEGRYDDAIALLQRGIRTDVGYGSPGGGRMARKLADALIAVGRTEEAIATLERVPRLHAIVGPSSGYEWLKVRERLARLYRDAGREADADAVEAELEALLAVADEDHPIKRRLAARDGR